MTNKYSKDELKLEFESKLKEALTGLQEHFKTDGWNINAQFYVNDIIENMIGIRPMDYLLFNTLNITKNMKTPLVLDLINGEWMFRPYDATKVYYNSNKNKIELIKPKKLNAKKKYKTTISLNPNGLPDKEFLGFL